MNLLEEIARKAPRCLAIAVAIALALLALHAPILQAPQIIEPGTSYWAAPQDRPYHLREVPMSMAGAFFLYLVATNIIGAFAIRSFSSARAFAAGGTSSALLLSFAAFPLGALAVVATLRLATFAFPNSQSWYAGLGLIFFSASVLAIMALRSHASDIARNPRSPLVMLCSIAAALIVAVIVQVQTNGTHILGDGTKYFLELINNGDILAPDRRFPAFDQHYDEIMYLFPFLTKGGNSIVLYCMYYAYAKASTVAFFLVVPFALLRSVTLSVPIASLLAFGSLHIIPLQYRNDLFDASSPLYTLLHTGRLYVDYLAVLGVWLLATDRSGRPLYELNPTSLVFLVLAIMGLSSVTLSAIIPLALLLLLPFLSAPSLSANATLTIATGGGLSFLLLGARSQFGDRITVVVGFLIAIATFGKAVAGLILRSLPSRIQLSDIYVTGGLAIAFVLSATLLGGFGIYKPLWESETIAQLLYRGIPVGDLHLAFAPFCGMAPHLYCRNWVSWVTYYGAPVFVALLASVAYKNADMEPGRNNTAAVPGSLQALAATAALASAALILSLWYLAFVQFGAPEDPPAIWLSWFNTRMVEPAFYVCLFFGLCALGVAAVRKGRDGVLAGVLAFWVLLHHLLFFQAGLFGQFVANVQFLVRHVTYRM